MLISPQDDRYTTPEGEFICHAGHTAVGELFKADFSRLNHVKRLDSDYMWMSRACLFTN